MFSSGWHISKDNKVRRCYAKTPEMCRAKTGVDTPHFETEEAGLLYQIDQNRRAGRKIVKKDTQIDLGGKVSSDTLNRVASDLDKFSVIAPDFSRAKFKRPVPIGSEESAAIFWSTVGELGVDLGDESDPDSIISIVKQLSTTKGHFRLTSSEYNPTTRVEQATSFGIPVYQNFLSKVRRGRNNVEITDYEYEKLTRFGLTAHRLNSEVTVQDRSMRGPKVIIKYFDKNKNITIEIVSDEKPKTKNTSEKIKASA